jgi:hypothetical protein
MYAHFFQVNNSEAVKELAIALLLFHLSKKQNSTVYNWSCSFFCLLVTIRFKARSKTCLKWLIDSSCLSVRLSIRMEQLDF